MLSISASGTMARTTLNLAGPILDELKQLQKKEKRSMGDLASELLAEAIAAREEKPESRKLRWKSKSMKARVDLRDEEALYAALDSRDS